MSGEKYAELVEGLCGVMHDAYEDAATKAGWETQERSRKPWADVPKANKVTMRAAVSAALDALTFMGWVSPEEAKAREAAARREALLEAADEQGDSDSPWKVAADALCEYAEQQEERAKKAEAKIGRAIDWARIERGELGAAELRGILAKLDDAPCSCGSRDATSLTPGERLHHSPDGCTIEQGGEDGMLGGIPGFKHLDATVPMDGEQPGPSGGEDGR